LKGRLNLELLLETKDGRFPVNVDGVFRVFEVSCDSLSELFTVSMLSVGPFSVQLGLFRKDFKPHQA